MCLGGAPPRKCLHNNARNVKSGDGPGDEDGVPPTFLLNSADQCLLF